MQHSRTVTQGAWARKVAPPWAFTVFDCADRLGVSVRWVRSLLTRHQIQSGMVERIVRLKDGSLRKRRVKVITRTGLELLLLRHAGFETSHDQPRRSP